MCPEADDTCWKFQSPIISDPPRPALCLKNNSMSQPTIPVLGCDYAKYKSESICKYAWGMHVAIPELLRPSKSQWWLLTWPLQNSGTPSRATTSEDSTQDFMVPPGAWVPSNMEGYGNGPSGHEDRQRGQQRMTQDNDGNNGADDHEDDMQGGSNDSNNRVPEDLDRLCQECSREGRAASCEGERQQACLWCRHLKCKCSCASGKLPASSSSLPPVKVTLQLPFIILHHTFTPANFSPLAGVNELPELFAGGFLAIGDWTVARRGNASHTQEIPIGKEELAHQDHNLKKLQEE
ncbi:hypothetical protein EDC04DRAFT_2618245 [Pisolithus marmoratus]|nr:hypothetical protein EDC04DRAFT_2618245 [Pisolithus marmoratus]